MKSRRSRGCPRRTAGVSTWPPPAEVDPELLLKSRKRLAESVLVELGERRPARERKQRVAAKQPQERPVPAPATREDRATRCLAAMRRITLVDQRDGSRRLFAAACRAVEHDLDDEAAVATIREYARERPFPRDRSAAEIVQRTCLAAIRTRSPVRGRLRKPVRPNQPSS